MNYRELIISITALASAVADKLSTEQLELTAAIATQFADTLTTISVKRSICAEFNEKTDKQHF